MAAEGGRCELSALRHAQLELQPMNPRHAALTLSVMKLKQTPFRFGRSPACEVCLEHDHRISSVHATLAADESGCVSIQDTSTNGTFVNGERLPRNSHRHLSNLDSFQLVIPDPNMIKSGYTGSLIANFVGYTVHYRNCASAPKSSASIVLAHADSSAAAVATPLNATQPISASNLHGVQPLVNTRLNQVAVQVPQSNSNGLLGAPDVEHVSFAAWWLAQRFGPFGETL